MLLLIVILLSYQVQCNYLLPTKGGSENLVPQVDASENFACTACTLLDSPKALHIIHIHIMSSGEAEGGDAPIPPGSPPREEPRSTPRAIQLTVKYPTFNWDQINLHEHFKWFKQRTEILMEGPYEDYKDADKVAAVLGWLGDRGHQIYAGMDWAAMELNKKKYKDVLQAFTLYLQPMQTTMHTWYQLGNIYSSQCKDQTEFMTRLKDLSKDTGFKEPEELVKFLFVIHNTDTKVREYLIDKGKPTHTCTEFLTMARTLEGVVKTETLSRELLGSVGRAPVSSVQQRGRGRGRARGRGRGYRSYSRPGTRSATPGSKDCGKCGKRHPPRKCPAYNKVCLRCNLKGHFKSQCKTKNIGQPQNQRSRREQYEVSRPEAAGHYSDYELTEDSVQIVFKRGPKDSKSTNIMFDEITNTQALGDVNLSNKAGGKICQRFKLDSGACANLLPKDIYDKLFTSKDRDLRASIDHRVSLIAANNNVIKQLGTVRLRVKSGSVDKVCKFFVVPSHCRPLLGLPDLIRLDMVQFKVPTTTCWSDEINTMELTSGLTKEQVLEEYKDVFTGLGRLKVEPIKIHLKEGAKPCRRPCRRVPVAMRQKFKDELDNLEGRKVLRKLKPNEVPEWLNSFVCPVKDDNSLRVCLDPTGLNPYIIRPVFNSHTLEEISHELKGAKVLTVCDANKGFFQVPLDKDSQLLTAMLTPEGIYVHNVLAMGLSLASDVFEQIIRDIIKDLRGVINIADDLLVYGKTIEEHDENLKALLDRCREVCLTLNPKKLKFKSDQVPFFGNIVTSKGVKPDPKKVEAIKQWPQPTNVKELQSFLGAINYLSKYIPHLSSLRATLQTLVKKNSEYVWTPTHDRAFQDLKEAICQETLL